MTQQESASQSCSRRPGPGMVKIKGEMKEKSADFLYNKLHQSLFIEFHAGYQTAPSLPPSLPVFSTQDHNALQQLLAIPSATSLSCTAPNFLKLPGHHTSSKHSLAINSHTSLPCSTSTSQFTLIIYLVCIIIGMLASGSSSLMLERARSRDEGSRYLGVQFDLWMRGNLHLKKN